MTTQTTQETAQAWREHAYELVQWTLQRLVNRADVYGVFPDRGPDDPCVAPEAVKGSLTERRLARHYAATSRTHLLAVHAMSQAQATRWLMIGLRRRTDGDQAATPGTNFDVALHWYEKLRQMGFDPILEDGDGQGGYRLITLFDEPVAVDQASAFGQQVTVDYADKGLTEPPRIVPTPDVEGDGAWMRLPGLHPGGEHASRVWDGDRWLDGGEAIAAILRAKPTPPTFIRAPRPQPTAAALSGKAVVMEPGRPIVLPKAAPPEPRRRSSSASGKTAVMPAITLAAAARITAARAADLRPTVARTVEPRTADYMIHDVTTLNLKPPPDVEVPTMISTMKPEVARTTVPSNGSMTHVPPPTPVDLPEATATVVAAIADRTGMRESEIIKRLFAWFGEQDEVVQALVLGQIPQALRPNANQLLAERLASH